MNQKMRYRGFLIVICIFILFSFQFKFVNKNSITRNINYENKINSSASEIVEEQWLKNTNFSTQSNWFYTKGPQGDNSTIDANISNGEANYIVIGENDTFSVLAGDVNTSTWYGWDIYNNSDYLLPDVTEINATGCYVYHYLDEEALSGGAGQVHNFPSVHFKKNITTPEDMSDYKIISASLEVIFNASVDSNVDVPGDLVDQSAIWDSATFYMKIADLNLSYAFGVAEYKTTNLGQDSGPILTITDTAIPTVNESDLITALNLALEKHDNHSKFTVILGLDVYCEDNDYTGDGDQDLWKALIFKSFNLTFTYEKKIEQFTSISWNQIANTLNESLQIKNATLNFKYKIDYLWPTSSSPFSELTILINNNKYPETIRLSNASLIFQDAKQGGFDVTSLISKGVNISLSLQIFIANTFGLGRNITISIDDIYLNITYMKIFPDIEPTLQIFLNGENKTVDPYIEVPIGEILNISVKFGDDYGNHINGAQVQLSGIGILEPLDEDIIHEQYSVLINTTSKLSKGTNILSITAERENYQDKDIALSIVVRNINTEVRTVSGSTTFNIKPGGKVKLSIFLEDLDFNQPIIGALILYNWDLGQGVLTDPDNNGVYEVLIKNIPEGTYKVVITVFAGDNYHFESYELTINAFMVAGPDWTILIIILSIGIIGLISFIFLYQFHFKYPLLVRKVRKLRKKVRKDKKLKSLVLPNREHIIHERYQNLIKSMDLEQKQNLNQINKNSIKIKYQN